MIRARTSLAVLCLASVASVLALVSGLLTVVAGFTDDLIWPAVAREAPAPLILGTAALGLAASHVFAIKRRRAWPHASKRVLALAIMAIPVGFILWSDSGFYACGPDGCYNLAKLMFPVLRDIPQLRVVEQTLGVLLFLTPAFALGLPKRSLLTSHAAA
jgi:hypothetical protein